MINAKEKICHIELLSGSLLFILLHALFAPYIAVLLVFVTGASMVFHTECDASEAVFTMIIWYAAVIEARDPGIDQR